MSYSLQELRILGALDTLAVQLSRGLCRLVEGVDPEVELAVALLSQHVAQGHVCLDLEALAAHPPRLQLPDGSSRTLPLPPLESWRAQLSACALVDADAPAGSAPLVLDWPRLYLRRHFEHERALATWIRARASLSVGVDARWLESALQTLFPPSGTAAAGPQLSLGFESAGSGDLQRQACARALGRRFFVISGGPGTGKTSTVVKLLALVVQHALDRGEPPPRMHLLAPTGKAAARLSSSIAGARDRLQVPEAVRAAIPREAATIHRVLGMRAGRAPGFAHDRRTPLVTDLVLVDEASMVDLTLMARLFDAVPDGARVVLLGDSNQLSSVEAGAVLGDLCGVGLPEPAKEGAMMGASVVELTHSYRFPSDRGIGRLAAAIRRGDAEGVLALLHGPDPEVVLDEGGLSEGLSPALRRAVLEGYRPYLEADGPAAQLEAFERFRVLCAHRRGPHGVERLNERIEDALARTGGLQPTSGPYVGRPLMVTRNDYGTQLFNGDVGLVCRGIAAADGEGAALTCHFAAEDGQTRQVATARLPPHESVFAMSVHKSQGSEFDEVAVVLPPAGSALLSRELLYTAVTRARRRVTIHGEAEVVADAVRTAVGRATGLRDLLWSPPA